MIEISIKPREGDRRYDIHVGDAGNTFLVSHQGYENAVDAERIARRLFGSPATLSERQVLAGQALVEHEHEPVELVIEYRDGKAYHEMIR